MISYGMRVVPDEREQILNLSDFLGSTSPPAADK